MPKVGIRQNGIHFSVALVLALSTAPSFFLKAQAQSGGFTLPAGNGGTPGKTHGGASRSPIACPQDASVNDRPLTALDNPALSAAAHPTFQVYVPQTAARAGELSVFDENSNGIYQTTVALTGRPGVVSIRLPDSEPALDLGKRYQWKFAMICNPEDRLSQDRVVSGWIQQSEPTRPSVEAVSSVKN